MTELNFTKERNAAADQNRMRLNYCLEQMQKLQEALEKEYEEGEKSSGYMSRSAQIEAGFSFWQENELSVEPTADWNSWSHKERIAYLQRNLRILPGQDDLTFSSMYEMYRNCPQQADYMERLVQRLGEAQFASEPTLRLKILKQFVYAAEWKTEELFRDGAELYGLQEPVTKEQMLEKLDESVFTLIEEKLTAAELADAILKTIDEDLLQVSVAAEDDLLSRFPDFDPAWSLRKKLEYLCRYQAEEDTEEDRILLRFAEAAEEAVRKQMRGKTVSKEEKEPGKRLTQRKKDYKDRKRKEHTLLRTADALAKAVFLKKHPTKEMLYRFAVVFGMTVSAGKGDLSFDAERDVEKNLFHDYYSDSLLKYFGEDYDKKKTNIEEPEGAGIDWKNWMELCFLYALRQEEMTADEKMKLADRLIFTVLRTDNRKKKIPRESMELLTRYYREAHPLDELEWLSEKEVVQEIRQTYHIPKTKKTTMADLSRQNTAQKYYDRLVASLVEESEGMAELECFDYNNLCIQPFLRMEDQRFRKVMENLSEKMLRLDAKTSTYRKVEKQLKKLEEAGRLEKVERKKRLRKLRPQEEVSEGNVTHRYCVLWQEKTPVTRTKLLAAMFYHYYHMGALLPGVEPRDIRCFDDILVYFEQTADPVLEECRYQKISSKNLFDMILMLLAFYYSS